MRHRLAITTALLLAALSAGAIAAVQEESTRGLVVGQGSSADDGPPIGLRVTFSRADPVYAIGEQLGLTISAARSASIEVWELEPDGKLNKILPTRGETLVIEAGRQLRLPLAGMNFRVGPPVGTSELHVIAKAGATTSRSLDTADTRLAGRNNRQEVRLRYKVVAP